MTIKPEKFMQEFSSAGGYWRAINSKEGPELKKYLETMQHAAHEHRAYYEKNNGEGSYDKYCRDARYSAHTPLYYINAKLSQYSQSESLDEVDERVSTTDSEDKKKPLVRMARREELTQRRKKRTHFPAADWGDYVSHLSKGLTQRHSPSLFTPTGSAAHVPTSCAKEELFDSHSPANTPTGSPTVGRPVRA